jgi:hypothetical protein
MRRKALTGFLLWTLCAGLVAPDGVFAAPPEAGSYPPYPDVWDWSASHSPPAEAFLDLRAMANGDLLISYEPVINDKLAPAQVTSFFGRRQFASVSAAFAMAPPEPRFIFNIALPDGKTVRRSGPPPCIRHLGLRLVVEDAAHRRLAQKTLLYLLDKPKHSRPPECSAYPAPSYIYRVAILDPRLMPLADSTFLAAAPDAGIVVRFDDKLDTRSPLLGKRLFLVDPEALDRFARHYGPTDTPTGFDWAAFHRDLPGWLRKTQGGGDR